MKFYVISVMYNDDDCLCEIERYKNILNKYNLKKENDKAVICLKEMTELIELQQELQEEIIISKRWEEDKYFTLQIYDSYRE
ncbi:hypothetical protein [Clostridium botulinum]|uniref:hypothetical protein n=1 Tax=Clostridium botulinum TaxID=1491 RepID=UPI000A176852|nr:hypothetical protein [Clostridium botulinum]AUN11458.1 hypothetical protein RSJ6_13500 [Clostridium botulinum]OSA67690.1 hypothetical protein B2H87_17525 [Clostridium botulinum]